MARLEGFEPPTHGLEVNNPELPNLLNLLEAIEIPELLLSLFFLSWQVLAYF